MTSTSNSNIKRTNGGLGGKGEPREIKISNTPHDNWLLWNFRIGKESQKISSAEIKLLKIKEELDNIKKL